MKSFDLNIGKILENWEVYHAIREIIANALDEMVLTNTQEICIAKKDDGWHITDFGRGINYHHLTQNENKEKLDSDKLIGRFGFGLKDALATLYRHNVRVKILSKHGIITLKEENKSGFSDIVTLHAEIAEPLDAQMIGTDFVLDGCSDDDVERAKELFLLFSSEDILETTPYGQVIENYDEAASIYINGVKVAEEPDFLFSYNITALTKQLKKAINRERTNVGRTAYADRVKSILTACKDEYVIECLIDDFLETDKEDCHDELKWNDVAIFVSRHIARSDEKVAFVTAEDALENPDVIDDMKSQGLTPVVVSSSLVNKMEEANEDEEDQIMTTGQFLIAQSKRLDFEFIDLDCLTDKEKRVYNSTDAILDLIGGKPEEVEEILISQTLYSDEGNTETLGLWQPEQKRIIIKRSQLQNLQDYAGTLIHECTHATSGEPDVSRSFESELTEKIGLLAKKGVASERELKYFIWDYGSRPDGITLFENEHKADDEVGISFDGISIDDDKFHLDFFLDIYVDNNPINVFLKDIYVNGVQVEDYLITHIEKNDFLFERVCVPFDEFVELVFSDIGTVNFTMDFSIRVENEMGDFFCETPSVHISYIHKDCFYVRLSGEATTSIKQYKNIFSSDGNDLLDGMSALAFDSFKSIFDEFDDILSFDEKRKIVGKLAKYINEQNQN